jgi:hypothetical protein
MDRAVIPSYLIRNISPPDNTSNFVRNYQEDSLRIGVIEEIIPPSSPQSRSKKQYEYIVGVLYYKGTSTLSYTKYYNCVQMDMFGSVADKYHSTLRKGTNDSSKAPFTKGAKVLILCVNSDTSQGVIVGGFPNNNVSTADEQAGHHLSFEFNGIQVNINNEGELLLNRRGPTDENGKVLSESEEYGGAQVKLLSDGSVSISSGTSTVVSMTLSPESGKVNLTCDGNVEIDCGTGNGVVVNQGTHPMVRGDELVSALATLVNGIAQSLTAITPSSPAGAAAIPGIQAALAQFQASTAQFFSSGNKVD